MAPAQFCRIERASTLTASPTLSIIVPTAGRATLPHLLMSVQHQPLLSGDECIIVGDVHDGPLAETADLVASYGEQFRYIPHDAGHHCWGHCQINAAMTHAQGAYVLFNDDDDIFTPGALARVRCVIAHQEQPRPVLCRFVTHYGLTFWYQPGVVGPGVIGGHCIVAPNDPAQLGQWGCQYIGDYVFIHDTLAHYDKADWDRAIIAIARPSLSWRQVQTSDDIETLRALRNAGREWLTHDTREISPEQQAQWWAARNPDHILAYLFSVDGHDAGAGVLSQRTAGRWWITVLVHPEYRGQGIGAAIFRMLACAAPGDVYAEIRRDNAASIKAAQRAGYAMAGKTEQCIIAVARQGRV